MAKQHSSVTTGQGDVNACSGGHGHGLPGWMRAGCMQAAIVKGTTLIASELGRGQEKLAVGGIQVLWQGQKLGVAGTCKYLGCCPCARPAQHGQVFDSYMCTMATQMDQDRAQNDPTIPTLCMYARQMLMCFTNCDVGPTLSKKHGISSSLNCLSFKVLWLF